MRLLNNSITRYFQSSFAELKKVSWPNRKEVINLTIVVIVSIGIATLVVMGIDYLLTKAINYIVQQ
ncbi:preprotein translocase subunit SecE [Patescibacteria group bacterium]